MCCLMLCCCVVQLQGIVAELKAGFTRALLELSHIQHGDSRLQSQLQETQSCCHKRALHLEALVQSLREELGEVRAQIRLLCGNLFKPEQESKMPQSAEARAQGSGVTQGNSETGHSSNMCQREDGGCQCQCQCEGSSPASPASSSSSLKAGLLLHCYLQGLRAAQYLGTDGTVNCQVVPMCVRVPQTVIGSWGGEMPRPCSLEGRRQQVIVQLLQSEWEYVSSLGQLYDKYKSPPEQANAEPQKVFLRHVEQLLQRHLVFRNALEEKLAADQWRCLVGDVFGKLTGHGEAVFSEAYLGYVSTLPAILNAEISRVQQAAKTHNANAQGCQEKKEGAGLISLLFSPVSRIHSYLSIIQSLLDWTGGDHPDRHLLEDTQRILGHIRSRGHTLLEQDVQSEERPAAAVTGLRCEIPSPDCLPSAFTKYSPNSRDTLTRSQPHRQDNQLANSHPSNLCHPVPNAGGWSQGPSALGCSAWSLPPDATPVRVLGPRERPGDVRFLLHPSEPEGGAATDSDPGQGPSPQPLGKRMYTSEVYHINSHRPVVDFETDPEELGEASVFDYSSVTTCSPDDTLELHGNGLERSNGTEESRGEDEEEEEEEEEDEEDSQIPVLLKPSYTLPRLKPSGQRPPLSPRMPHREGGHREGGHREGAVCTRWQIPRAAPNPPTHTQAHTQMQAGSQVCMVATGTGERRERRVKLQRQPSRAFRPIWDQPYRQGDETPDRDQSQPHRGVTSQGHSAPNPQQDRDGVRSSLYSGGGTQVGTHGNRNAWNESEDSEGPCSTV
ncbi:hypothetical protein ACEWY4_005525 [Coilia grayii]|uniref:DH domain-containing protein n=1 Tax=Coilia grayii TaxID=363190 RepID=A0ABD1KIQ7_9TELE